MTPKQLIKELDDVIAYYDIAKGKATGLRKKLERFHASTSRKRAKEKEEEARRQLAHALAKRRKRMNITI